MCWDLLPPAFAVPECGLVVFLAWGNAWCPGCPCWQRPPGLCPCKLHRGSDLSWISWRGCHGVLHWPAAPAAACGVSTPCWAERRMWDRQGRGSERGEGGPRDVWLEKQKKSLWGDADGHHFLNPTKEPNEPLIVELLEIQSTRKKFYHTHFIPLQWL